MVFQIFSVRDQRNRQIFRAYRDNPPRRWQQKRRAKHLGYADGGSRAEAVRNWQSGGGVNRNTSKAEVLAEIARRFYQERRKNF